jgi:trk system potassium uptake protein TrkA
MKAKAKVFLVGGFNKTKFLANSLIKKGYRVTAINSDEEKCIALAKIDKLTVFSGDGSRPYVLEEANIHGADIAIALSDRDDDNLVICELCKKKYSVKKTVAIISDPQKTDFFYRMGIDSVVCAVSAVASVIEQQAFLNEISTLISVGETNIKISQVAISPNAPAADKKLKEINLPRQVVVGCVLRGDASIVPRGDTDIRPGDVLILISSDEHEMPAIRKLTGG